MPTLQLCTLCAQDISVPVESLRMPITDKARSCKISTHMNLDPSYKLTTDLKRVKLEFIYVLQIVVHKRFYLPYSPCFCILARPRPLNCSKTLAHKTPKVNKSLGSYTIGYKFSFSSKYHHEGHMCC